MIDTAQTEVIFPALLVAAVEIIVPENSFPIQISQVDSVEVIATGSTGSVEVVFPGPLSSTVIVLPTPGPKGDKGDKGDKGNDGLNGTDGIDGQDGADGQPGQNGLDGGGLTIVHLTAAQYAALTVEQQTDPLKWWVIPKT